MTLREEIVYTDPTYSRPELWLHCPFSRHLGLLVRGAFNTTELILVLSRAEVHVYAGFVRNGLCLVPGYILANAIRGSRKVASVLD